MISEFFLELRKNGYEWEVRHCICIWIFCFYHFTKKRRNLCTQRILSGEFPGNSDCRIKLLRCVRIADFLLKFNQIRDNFDTQSLGDNLFPVSSKTRYRKNSTGHVISSSHKGLNGTLSIHQLTWHKFMPALSSCWLPMLCATFYRVFIVYFPRNSFHDHLLKLFVSFVSYNFTRFFRYFAEARVSTHHLPCNNFFVIIFNRRYILFLIGLKVRHKICSNFYRNTILL